MIDPTPLDITHNPHLRHLVAEMRSSRKPRLLKENSKPVAMLMPLGTTLKRHPNDSTGDIWANYQPQQVQEALAKSAGALAGGDTKRLLTDIHEARSQE